MSLRIRRLLTATAWLAVAALAGGCTAQRIGEDTAQALAWVRLKNAAHLDTVSRWQLPQHAHIQVEQAGPPPHEGWLPAAQAGVNAVFPAGGPLATHGFTLLVAWPGAEPPRGPEVSMWEVVDMDQFLPDFQEPFTLRLALVRRSDGAVVEAALLRVSPHWFASRSNSPRLVHDAFADFAARLRPAY